MKATVKGSIQPPRGTPGANGAYIVDLEIEIPDHYKEASARLDRVLGSLGDLAARYFKPVDRFSG